MAKEEIKKIKISNGTTELKDEEDIKKKFEEICKYALDQVDVLATYHHYKVFDEIKIIWKDNEVKSHHSDNR